MNAAKDRFGAEDLRKVFAGARKVVVAKGKKLVEIDLEHDPSAWRTLAEVAIGPSGNLRAPAVRAGTTWLVGFHEDAYADVLG